MKKESVKSTGKPVKPKFLTGEASKFWDQIVNAYDGAFGVEDTPILVLAVQAWEQYRESYSALSHGKDTDTRSATLVCKWFDRVYKLLVALGLTPCQRKNLNVPPHFESVGAVERRPGGDRSMTMAMDEEDDDS